MGFSHEIQIKLEAAQVDGLNPTTWMIVESALSREEIKNFYLTRGRGFTGQSILSLESFCMKLLQGLVEKTQVLGARTRIEILREILQQARSQFPELKRLRRRSSFFKKLDRSFQEGRLLFSTQEEYLAQSEALKSSGLRSLLREEVTELFFLYEAFLKEKHLWDLPRLLIASVAVLKNQEIDLSLPSSILWIGLDKGQSRVESFCEELSKRTHLERFLVSEYEVKALENEKFSWNQFHTFDDACEVLGQKLYEASLLGEGSSCGVLMPDDPSMRRSLGRVLNKFGLPLEDPRDPTQILWEEPIKKAFLPLDLVSSLFNKEIVCAFLWSPFIQADDLSKRKVYEWLQGLGLKRLVDLDSEKKQSAPPEAQTLIETLVEFQVQLGASLNIQAVQKFHLAWIEKNTPNYFDPWVKKFFESEWTHFTQDLQKVGRSTLRSKLLYWNTRIKERILEATPPVSKLQWEGGVKLYRMGTLALSPPSKLYVLGLNESQIQRMDQTDYWMSEREREMLSSSFQIQTSTQRTELQKKILKIWLSDAHSVEFMDAAYEWNGKESESLKPVFEEILGFVPEVQLNENEALKNRQKSLLPYPLVAPQSETIPNLIEEKNRIISASTLDTYTKCPFLGLTQSLWRLGERKDSQVELASDQRGSLLHLIVHKLLKNSGLELEEAFNEAWTEMKQKRVYQSSRIKKSIQSRIFPLLRKFQEVENEYRKHSGSQILSLEGPKLVDQYSQTTLQGYPDRIDQHSKGLVLIDYKSSTDNPSAKEMLDNGYRLQLPFYALAASKHFGIQARALQFITFDKKGTRTKGLFMREDVSLEEGSILKKKPNARSSSEVQGSSDEVWEQLKSNIAEAVQAMESGDFGLKPKFPKEECPRCRMRDACGERRLLREGLNEE